MIRMTRTCSLAIALVLSSVPGQLAAAEVDDAERVARAFLVGIYQNDEAGASEHVTSEAGLEGFIGKQALGEAAKTAVRDDIRGLEIDLAPGYEDLGESVEAVLPQGASIRFSLAYRGVPMVVTTVKTHAGWKVDLRWWSAMRRNAEGRQVQKNDPEAVVRRYLIALLEHDLKKLRGLVPKGTDPISLYDSGYEPPYEDQYYYLALEMPVVEIGQDELVRLEGGEFGRSPAKGAEKFLVGLYWDIAMPFHLVPEGKGYRVVPGGHLDRIMGF